MSLSGVVSNGSIILFVGNDVPPEYAFPVTFAGNQPLDQKAQGYPSLRGMLVKTSKLDEDIMGVSIDELTQ